MDEVDELIKELEMSLSRPIRLAHQCASMATNLHLLVAVHDVGDDSRVVDIKRRFDDLRVVEPCRTVLANQMQYAIRLCTDAEPLLYEEMHKLYALADEVHALIALCFEVGIDLRSDFSSALRQRLDQQNGMARLVADDRAASWNRNLWWYADYL